MMGIGTILLMAVAVGVTVVMLRLAHGSRAAPDRAGEAGGGVGDAGEREAADPAKDPADASGPAQSHGGHRHGCC